MPLSWSILFTQPASRLLFAVLLLQPQLRWNTSTTRIMLDPCWRATDCKIIRGQIPNYPLWVCVCMCVAAGAGGRTLFHHVLLTATTKKKSEEEDGRSTVKGRKQWIVVVGSTSYRRGSLLLLVSLRSSAFFVSISSFRTARAGPW